MTDFMESIDWDLLHRQKMRLTDAACSRRILKSDLIRALEGVVELLDVLQNEAELRELWVHPLSSEGQLGGSDVP